MFDEKLKLTFDLLDVKDVKDDLLSDGENPSAAETAIMVATKSNPRLLAIFGSIEFYYNYIFMERLSSSRDVHDIKR